jgi:hypothetical protein
MRLRLAFTGLALLGALASVIAPARGAAAEAPAAHVPVKVKLVECSLAEHAAAFRSRMNRLPGSERMGMRFTLQERTGAGFEAVEAPGLDRWRRSKAGVGAFSYRQGVRNLALNAAYRMRVDFRWWSASGRAVRRARRLSPVCRQYAALPNLRARVLGAAGTKVAGVVRYAVRLRNAGSAAATEAALRLTVDGNVVDTRTVPALAPGEQRTLTFRGPDCGQSVEARADPDALIVETSEVDNAQLVACADLRRR